MRLVPSLSIVALAASFSAFGCASSGPEGPPATAEIQIQRGAKSFGEHCSRCHGDAGQGSKKAPPLVGANALPLDPRAGQKRTQRFHTALDVAQFATQNMPPDASDREELTAADYWAILAFDLSANGVKVTSPLTPENAAGYVLHP